MAGTKSGTATTMATAAATPPEVASIPTAGRVSSAKQKSFSAKGSRQRTRQHGAQLNDSIPNGRIQDRGPANATPTTAATTTGRVPTPARRIPTSSTSTKH